jgi:hypothetical protein
MHAGVKELKNFPETPSTNMISNSVLRAIAVSKEIL